ncbi:MAG: hypothetical protein ABGY13_01175 [Verrucomicrobiia bacterium]
MIGDTYYPRQCSKENPRQPKLTRGTNYEKMNVVVKDSMIGYVFKEKTRLRKTNDGGWGVDVAPPPLWGSPTPSAGWCSQNIPKYDKQKPQQSSLFSGQMRVFTKQ